MYLVGLSAGRGENAKSIKDRDLDEIKCWGGKRLENTKMW